MKRSIFAICLAVIGMLTLSTSGFAWFGHSTPIAPAVASMQQAPIEQNSATSTRGSPTSDKGLEVPANLVDKYVSMGTTAAIATMRAAIVDLSENNRDSMFAGRNETLFTANRTNPLFITAYRCHLTDTIGQSDNSVLIASSSVNFTTVDDITCDRGFAELPLSSPT